MSLKDTKIAVVGDGGWGTTLAILLARQRYPVHLWGAFPAYVEATRKKRENIKFLPGFKIPKAVTLTADLRETCRKARLVVLVVPSQFMRGVLQKIKKEKLTRHTFVTAAKGIETKSLKVMSQVIREELGPVRLAVISGPTIARDVALELPSAASVASTDAELRAEVRTIFTTDTFSLFESDDVLGIELGGALKNVIAIGAGLLQGLGLGSNTRAVLFARGVAEMARLGEAMGARRETFMGLSGLGDLATTCLSPHSRNRSLGEKIGKGRRLEAVLKTSSMVVEGVDTCKSAYQLAKKFKVSMPITEAVHGVLFHGQKPHKVVEALMKHRPYWERA